MEGPILGVIYKPLSLLGFYYIYCFFIRCLYLLHVAFVLYAYCNYCLHTC